MPPPSHVSKHRSDSLHPLASSKEIVQFSDCREVFEVLARYQLQGPISRGTFGFVARAFDNHYKPEGGEEEEAGPNFPPGTVAIKKVRSLFDHPRLWLSAIRELKMLRFFQHPNVIRANDIMIPLGETNNLSATSIRMRQRNFDEVYIVMDYMDNTLRGLMNDEEPSDLDSPLLKAPFDLSKRLTANPEWKDVRPMGVGPRAYLLFQILHGLKYLHGCGVIHRDLKPDNVLVDWQWQAKLCDFGQGRGGLVGDTAIDQSEIGQVTQWYCSPEHLRFVVNSDANQSQMDEETFHAIDVWSVGCIAAEMIIGKPLFDCKSPGGAFQLDTIMNILGKPQGADEAALIRHNPHGIAEVIRSSRTTTENRLATVLRAGITGRAANFQPSEEQPEPEEVNEHELELIMAMLAYDPAKRITIAQALESPFFENYREYAPTVEPTRFPMVEKSEDPVKARAAIWELFVECNPVVSELVEALEKSAQATPAPSERTLSEVTAKSSTNTDMMMVAEPKVTAESPAN